MRNDDFQGARRGNEAVLRGTVVLRVVLMSPSRTRRGQVVTIFDLEELENATRRGLEISSERGGGGLLQGLQCCCTSIAQKRNFFNSKKSVGGLVVVIPCCHL